MEVFLKSTSFLDFETPAFREFVKPFVGVEDEAVRAIAYYEHVRDFFIYDPYHLDLRKPALRASHIINKNRAWCVEKAIVFAAGLRAMNIPSRLGYAIVENHIGVERLTEILRTKRIVFHGYVDVYLSKFQSWTKATPAFDKRICRLSGVQPLHWNGTEDSLFQSFQGENKFMEYHHDYGIFTDVPRELMQAEMKKYYPHLFDGSVDNSKKFSFYFEP